MKTCLRLMCTGMFALAAASAQPQNYPQGSQGASVRGEISSSTPITGDLTVELAASGMGSSETTTVNGDGTFEFRSVSPGARYLRIIGASGRVIHEELVMVGGPNQLLSIRLGDQPNASRSADGTVSVRQLAHKVPHQAQKAYDQGRRAAVKGDQRSAAGFFRQAVALDPEFVDAYNELGAAEVALGQLPEAADQFQKAVDLVPEHRLALPNLSIVLAKMKRFREAGDVARRALRVLPGAARMQYILAVSLLMQHADSQEALDNLQRASGEIPKARIVAADALAQAGRREEAAQQLEQYLRTQPADDAERPKVEARLAQLRQ